MSNLPVTLSSIHRISAFWLWFLFNLRLANGNNRPGFDLNKPINPNGVAEDQRWGALEQTWLLGFEDLPVNQLSAG